MAYKDHFNHANYGDNIVYNNCSTHQDYSNTYFCSQTYGNYSDCETSYRNYRDCEVSHNNHGNHANTGPSHRNYGNHFNHSSYHYDDSYDDNSGTCANHYNHANYNDYSDYHDYRDDSGNPLYSMSDEKKESQEYSDFSSYLNYADKFDDNELSTNEDFSGGIQNDFDEFDITGYGYTGGHLSTGGHQSHESHSNYSNTAHNSYSDYSDCETSYSDYQDCEVSYRDCNVKCNTTIAYANTTDKTHPNLGAPEALYWDSGKWSGDTLVPERVSDSIPAVKEIRDKLFDLAAYKTNSSINRNVTPLNHLTDSDFQGDVKTTDEDYNSIVDTLNDLYQTFGISRSVSGVSDKSKMSKADIEKLKKEVDYFAGQNLGSFYTNHYNYANNNAYVNHSNHANYQNS